MQLQQLQTPKPKKLFIYPTKEVTWGIAKAVSVVERKPPVVQVVKDISRMEGKSLDPVPEKQKSGGEESEDELTRNEKRFYQKKLNKRKVSEMKSKRASENVGNKIRLSDSRHN